MKLTAPKYYHDFKCIAEECSHSCCIGWEIDVDDVTIEKYTSLSGGYADIIRSSIEFDDTPHFRLCDGEKCPHLDESGLCRIITEYGDGYLCNICREHPRFYNNTLHGIEVGLGMACEEACRIILNSDDYDKMTVIEEDFESDGNFGDFDIIPHRTYIYEILKSDNTHYADKIARTEEAFNISLTTMSDEEWRKILSSLEYLDESHRELFSRYSSSVEAFCEKMLERAFAYYIYRHVSSAWDEESLRARVGFSLFCERLLASVIAHTKLDPVTAARIVSEEIEYSEENTQMIIDVFI